MRFSATHTQKKFNNFHQSSKIQTTRSRKRQRERGRGQSGDPKKELFLWCLRYAPDPLLQKHFGTSAMRLNAFLFATINTPRAPVVVYPRFDLEAVKCAPNVHRRSEMCTECAPNQPN
jgi:hypothetical protein